MIETHSARASFIFTAAAVLLHHPVSQPGTPVPLVSCVHPHLRLSCSVFVRHPLQGLDNGCPSLPPMPASSNPTISPTVLLTVLLESLQLYDWIPDRLLSVTAQKNTSKLDPTITLINRIMLSNKLHRICEANV